MKPKIFSGDEMTEKEREAFHAGARQGEILARMELSDTGIILRMEKVLDRIDRLQNSSASWKEGWEAGIRNDPEYGQGGG